MSEDSTPEAGGSPPRPPEETPGRLDTGSGLDLEKAAGDLLDDLRDHRKKARQQTQQVVKRGPRTSKVVRWAAPSAVAIAIMLILILVIGPWRGSDDEPVWEAPTASQQEQATASTGQQVPQTQQTPQTQPQVRPMTASTETARDPAEGVWDLNWVDDKGAVQQAVGLVVLTEGTITYQATGATGTYGVVDDPGATSVTMSFSQVSEADGNPMRTVMHCTLQADGAVLAGWVEADVVTVSGSGESQNVHRSDGMQKLLWGVLATRVSD